MEKSERHAFVKAFLEAKIAESASASMVNSALFSIDRENQIFTLVPAKTQMLLTDMLEAIIGAELMEWVYWWWLECDHGTKHFDFSVNGRGYTASELTLEQFLNIVDGEAK